MKQKSPFLALVFYSFLTFAKSQNGPRIVPNGEFFGLQNERGAWIAEPKFLRLGAFERGFFLAIDSTEKVGLIDSAGRVRVPFEYNFCEPLGRGPFFIARKKEEKFALLDSLGQPLTDMIFAEIEWREAFPKLVFAQKSDGKWLVLDEKGQPTGEPFDDLSINGLHGFAAQRGRFWAFFRPEGQPVTAFKYYLAKPFYSQKVAEYHRKAHSLPEPRHFLGLADDEKGSHLIDDAGREWPVEPKD